MEFEVLRKELKGFDYDKLRMDCDNCFEAVVMREELDKLSERLQKFFGQPAWPSRSGLSFQVQETVDAYGGIMPGQTLYFGKDKQDIVFAMLWPWKDGERTTVRVIKKI